MDNIRSIIWEILESPSDVKKINPPRVEMVEEFEDVDYDDIFTDCFITIKNLEDFYNQEVDNRATQLLESFLIEALILLKQNEDITLVSSGPSYVKATAFTPEGETAASIFNDVVEINSMLEIYNDALVENNLPKIDAGIGLSSYQSLQDEHHCHCGCNDSDDCDCNCDENHECDCEHEENDFISDSENWAERLAEIANTNNIDSIVVNESFYGLISDISEIRSFFDENFQKVLIEDENIVFYHSNIVIDEKN